MHFTHRYPKLGGRIFNVRICSTRCEDLFSSSSSSKCFAKKHLLEHKREMEKYSRPAPVHNENVAAPSDRQSSAQEYHAPQDVPAAKMVELYEPFQTIDIGGGMVLKGRFTDGLPEGVGLLTFANGDQYYGTWAAGEIVFSAQYPPTSDAYVIVDSTAKTPEKVTVLCQSKAGTMSYCAPPAGWVPTTSLHKEKLDGAADFYHAVESDPSGLFIAGEKLLALCHTEGGLIFCQALNGGGRWIEADKLSLPFKEPLEFKAVFDHPHGRFFQGSVVTANSQTRDGDMLLVDYSDNNTDAEWVASCLFDVMKPCLPHQVSLESVQTQEDEWVDNDPTEWDNNLADDQNQVNNEDVQWKPAQVIAPGLTYEGFWKGDKMEGAGVLSWSNGDTFQGEFASSKPVFVPGESVDVYAIMDDDAEKSQFKKGDIVVVVAMSQKESFFLCQFEDSLDWISSEKFVEQVQ
eukprot:TRINITY_DN3263_c0_g1_i7.p1 TRINITY_DN3263_c0_g1~~TRINITY_DN3263_c0_g1_i7.p1  ORF type:complete len:460 (+),score=106.09 TRINITY_DN3263_c0_g1_i7:717-2096(+)